MATDGTRFAAATAAGRRTQTFIELFSPDTEGTRAFEAGFRAIAESAGAGRDVVVTVCPPLAHGRVIALPRMRPDQMRSVLERDLSRYFPALRGPGVAQVELQNTRGSPVPAIACAIELDAIESLCLAAEAAGLRCRAVIPSWTVWAAMQKSATRGHAQHRAQLVVPLAGRIEVLHFRGGILERVRRAGVHGEAWRGQVLELEGASETPCVHVLGGGSVVQQAMQALFGDAALTGQEALRHTGDRDPLIETAAAALSIRAAGFRTPAQRARLRRTMRRQARGMAAAGVLLMIAAAATELESRSRQLRDVEEARARLAPQLAPAMAAMSALDRQRTIMDGLSRAAAALRWSEVLVDIAALLPDDSHVTSLHADGDSVLLRIAGGEPAAVLQSLGGPAAVRDARLVSVPRRADGAGPSTFGIVMRFVTPGALRGL